MNYTVPPEGNPGEQNDSHPTAAEQPTGSVELAEYHLADEELLARLDPEIQELARHIGDKIANLTYLVDERDEQQQRIDQLEVQVRDLRTLAQVFAQSGQAVEIIDRATEGRRTAYLAGYSDGAAGRTLAAEGIDTGPDETESGTPAVRAFTLGREIERRRWERLIDSERPAEPPQVHRGRLLAAVENMAHRMGSSRFDWALAPLDSPEREFALRAVRRRSKALTRLVDAVGRRWRMAEYAAEDAQSRLAAWVGEPR